MRRERERDEGRYKRKETDGQTGGQTDRRTEEEEKEEREMNRWNAMTRNRLSERRKR